MSLGLHRSVERRRRRKVLLAWGGNIAKTGVGLAKNPKGKVIRYTDPLGRETVYVYGTGSTPDPDPATGTGIDLLQVKQKNGAVSDLLSSATYDAQHLALTVTDTAGQVTTFTDTATGLPQTVVTPPRGGLTQAERTTTFGYFADNAPSGPGRLQTITGPISGATLSFTYDSYGRVRTVTDPDNFTLTYDYDTFDRVTKVTYPDTTYEQAVYNPSLTVVSDTVLLIQAFEKSTVK